MDALQAKLQVTSAEYQKLQNDLSFAVDSSQRLDSQLQENEMVKKVKCASVRKRVAQDLKTPWEGVGSLFFRSLLN